tara:strand:- start:284 stop:1054 length:771 start_codon:yes stop_codon:yes gene_type:complete
MLTKKVKRKDVHLYENIDEFYSKHPDDVYHKDWRNAPEGAYALTDDGQVCRILRRSIMKTANDIEIDYVRTILGTYRVQSDIPMQGKPPKNIYSFAKNEYCDKHRQNRENVTNNEFLFARYVVSGMDATDAYMKVFSTKNRKYAQYTASKLLKTKRILKLVSEEIEGLLSEVGASKRYLLESTKGIIDKDDSADNNKLRAIEILMKLAGMFPNEKQTESLTVFQGFTPEQLEQISSKDTKAIAHAERRIADGSKTK